MIICYFGDYDPNYARNRVLLKGLRENGAEVLECHSDKKGFGLYWELYKKHKKIREKYDILIVAQSFNTRLVWLAKLLSDKKIVWDAFYSLYDKYVNESKTISRYGIRAAYQWLRERLACGLADLILLDTNEHIKYFVQEFGVNQNKFRRVLVGAEVVGENVKKEKEDVFLILFYGNYSPLQGVEYIVRAAKILEGCSEIKLRLIGTGETYDKNRKLAEALEVNNIEFIKRMPYDELVKEIARADVCLGVFGNTAKTQRVIPNKVYDATALGKPIITSNTPAIRELFADKKNILLCNAADSKDLADKILKLKNDGNLRAGIAQGGYEVFKSSATPRVIGEHLLALIKLL
jgi:glycosyltransferase involved in cell wall biosynthesis